MPQISNSYYGIQEFGDSGRYRDIPQGYRSFLNSHCMPTGETHTNWTNKFKSPQILYISVLYCPFLQFPSHESHPGNNYLPVLLFYYVAGAGLASLVCSLGPSTVPGRWHVLKNYLLNGLVNRKGADRFNKSHAWTKTSQSQAFTGATRLIIIGGASPAPLGTLPCSSNHTRVMGWVPRLAHFPEAPLSSRSWGSSQRGETHTPSGPTRADEQENWGWGVRNEGSENSFKRTTHKNIRTWGWGNLG